MGVDQRTGEGSKPRIPRVVSKSDRDHGTATTDNRILGLTPAVTISRSNLSLSLYPILSALAEFSAILVKGVGGIHSPWAWTIHNRLAVIRHRLHTADSSSTRGKHEWRAAQIIRVQ